MILTKEIISSELRNDGSLKTKTQLTKIYTTQELYNFYHDTSHKKCEICQKETRFMNFKLGYDDVCSRSCRKELLSKQFIQDLNNTISIEELKEFLLKEFSNMNTSNKLNKAFFINNKYIKELNTLLLYMKQINEQNINIKVIHDLIFGVGICAKCSSETTFRGFGNLYSNTCSDNRCGKSLHINKFVEYEYVINNFIENGKFLIDDMMEYYNVSKSFVDKYKVKNNINIENKHKKYSLGERILFYTFKDDYNIKTNSRSIINPYEIDIVIDDRICIEYDGLMFHSKGLGFPGDCSKRFKDKLIPDNYEFLTIFEDEFIDITKRNIWISIIRNKLSEKQNISDYYIKEIDKNESNYFLEINSLECSLESDISIGLFDLNNTLLQVLTANKSKDGYLIKLCNSLNNNLEYYLILEYFERIYSPNKINIILNKRWNSINEYEKYGFKLIKETEPNKYYFKVNVNKLFLDSGENEEEMLRNNHRIIYDYGNLEMNKILINV
jgi:hypothetical protein